ncbi:MAG: 30S ribosomal protein S12 methylthiotransferase RimO [Desulfomonilaceae bacterium]
MKGSRQRKKQPAKAFTLASLGCPKNRVDSERILDAMVRHGFVFTQEASEADVVIVNTCAFIRPAVEESIDVIMNLRVAAPRAILVVAGCLPLRYKDELACALKEADLFISPAQIRLLPELLNKCATGRARAPARRGQTARIAGSARSLGSVVDSSVPSGCGRENKQDVPGRILTTPGYAYLKIAEGCNRLCRYCTIPKIRGRFKSQPFDDLVEESKRLADMGAKEIVLVAQDAVRYGRDLGMKNGICSLVRAIAEISGIQWIRLMYLHPHTIPPELPQLVNEYEKVLPYLDIPFQHVSAKVLRNMGRPWKGDYIRKLVDSLRAQIPGLVLRTTFMVGFPGEGDPEFQELRDFAASYRIEHIGVFEYSPEEGTPALALGDPVPSSVKKERANELRELHLDLASKRNRARIGHKEKAIIHGVSFESEYLLEGRLWDQAPEVDGLLYITDGVAAQGNIHDVRITDAYEVDLFGAIEDQRNDPRD